VFFLQGVEESKIGRAKRIPKDDTPKFPGRTAAVALAAYSCQESYMAKIAKTADRKKVMDTTKSTACPKCGKETRIVKRMKDRERGVPGGIYISCSACEFFEKL
jgi:DNA-directed RNA polymerase subunit M/transcription elongation factor TFIIS